MIGKFEEYCLMALIRSGPGSLASDIYDKLCDHSGKEFKFGAVYTTLDRMVDKEWVKVESRQSNARGKARRYFSITGLGQQVLNDSLNDTKEMASGIVPGFSFGGAGNV